jgi:hypothetical protein
MKKISTLVFAAAVAFAAPSFAQSPADMHFDQQHQAAKMNQDAAQQDKMAQAQKAMPAEPAPVAKKMSKHHKHKGMKKAAATTDAPKGEVKADAKSDMKATKKDADKMSK